MTIGSTGARAAYERSSKNADRPSFLAGYAAALADFERYRTHLLSYAAEDPTDKSWKVDAYRLAAAIWWVRTGKRCRSKNHPKCHDGTTP